MKCLDSEQLFAKLHITVHRRKPAVDRPDQVLVNGYRYRTRIQRLLHRIVIMVFLCHHICLLCICIIHRRNRIAVLTVDGIQGMKGVLPQGAVTALHIRNVASDRQRMLLAICILDVRKADIRIVKHRKNISRCIGQLTHPRQQLLRLCIQDMVAHSCDLLDLPTVSLQLRLLRIILCQTCFRQCKQLRLKPGYTLHHLHAECLYLTCQLLVYRISCILMISLIGIDCQL